jgi:hypothetical protein
MGHPLWRWRTRKSLKLGHPTKNFVSNAGSVIDPLRKHFRLPPFAKNTKDGAPNYVFDASEIKSLGHPPKNAKDGAPTTLLMLARSKARATRLSRSNKSLQTLYAS